MKIKSITASPCRIDFKEIVTVQINGKPARNMSPDEARDLANIVPDKFRETLLTAATQAQALGMLSD